MRFKIESCVSKRINAFHFKLLRFETHQCVLTASHFSSLSERKSIIKTIQQCEYYHNDRIYQDQLLVTINYFVAEDLSSAIEQECFNMMVFGSQEEDILTRKFTHTQQS